jgi:hypothetical protein
MRPAPECDNPVDVSTLDQIPGTEWICGCGRCPEPDPSPEELQRRVDDAAWRRAVSTDG